MQPGIEHRSPGPLANTLPTRPLSLCFCIYVYIYKYEISRSLLKNCSIQVDFIIQKKSQQNKGSNCMAGLKSKPLPQSGQAVEQYSKSRYTPPTITPANCHKHFQVKFVLGENIQYINTD